MTRGLTITKQVHFRHGRGTRKVLKEGDAPKTRALGSVPRVSRLMALAIHMQELVDSGEVTDYAELARLAHVSRARITQIMNRKRSSSCPAPTAAAPRSANTWSGPSPPSSTGASREECGRRCPLPLVQLHRTVRGLPPEPQPHVSGAEPQASLGGGASTGTAIPWNITAKRVMRAPSST